MTTASKRYYTSVKTSLIPIKKKPFPPLIGHAKQLISKNAVPAVSASRRGLNNSSPMDNTSVFQPGGTGFESRGHSFSNMLLRGRSSYHRRRRGQIAPIYSMSNYLDIVEDN